MSKDIEEKRLNLDTIRIDGGTQGRVGVDEKTVGEYAEGMVDGTIFPALDVFFDGVVYWLADGFHRWFASQKAQNLSALCRVHFGTKAEALWFALAANKGHGLRRSNEDKARAVKMALEQKWDMSDREIGRHVGVHHNTVAAMRKKLTGEIIQSTETTDQTETKRTGADGRTINTAKIGKGKPPEKATPQQLADYREADDIAARDGVKNGLVMTSKGPVFVDADPEALYIATPPLTDEEEAEANNPVDIFLDQVETVISNGKHRDKANELADLYNRVADAGEVTDADRAELTAIEATAASAPPAAPTKPVPAAKPIECPPVQPVIKDGDLPTHDEEGGKLPTKALRQVFAGRATLEKLATTISEIKCRVAAAVKEGNPAYAGLRAQPFDMDMNNAFRAIRDAKPYAICPHCAAAGCTACKSGGWVTKTQYIHAPSDLKLKDGKHQPPAPVEEAKPAEPTAAEVDALFPDSPTIASLVQSHSLAASAVTHLKTIGIATLKDLAEVDIATVRERLLMLMRPAVVDRTMAVLAEAVEAFKGGK